MISLVQHGIHGFYLLSSSTNRILPRQWIKWFHEFNHLFLTKKIRLNKKKEMKKITTYVVFFLLEHISQGMLLDLLYGLDVELHRNPSRAKLNCMMDNIHMTELPKTCKWRIKIEIEMEMPIYFYVFLKSFGCKQFFLKG